MNEEQKELVSNPEEVLQNDITEERGNFVKRYNCDVSDIDYFVMIIEIIKKMSDQKLLKRIYDLAEYLYVYEGSI